MKCIFRLSHLLLLFTIISSPAAGQGKDYFGEFRPAVEKAREYLILLQDKNSSALKRDFVPTGFQDKRDFLRKISSENMKWSSSIVKKYGIPGDEQTAISVWKVSTQNTETEPASINVSFYFKSASQPLSLMSDRISINLTPSGSDYLIDGILLFRKSEYDAMEKMIQDMP